MPDLRLGISNPSINRASADHGLEAGPLRVKRARASLRVKILVPLLALVAVSVMWAVVSIWSTYRMDVVLSAMTGRDLPALTAIQGLESELVMQKGYSTFYVLTGDPGLLSQVQLHQRRFEEWLARARQNIQQDVERVVLNKVESEYLRYAHFRDLAASAHAAGHDAEALDLNWEAHRQFEDTLKLCEEYRALHEKSIRQAAATYQDQTRITLAFYWTVFPLTFFLALLLGWVLLRQVLEPIRRLAMSVDDGRSPVKNDEIIALRLRMRALESDMDQAYSQLVESREQIKQSEKLALVGKLAAGVAHSIRNPFTSVKMRLFSLERGLSLNETQKEDFDVIGEEIKHLDTIIRNFLEFARRPKLEKLPMSPSTVVDQTLELLRHRLESGQVAVRLEGLNPLPVVELDPDQLKEALVNLIMNACEAMGQGGRILIEGGRGVVEGLGLCAWLKISDSGPGIPEAIRADIFQPFYSTKEEGTGLGLPIVARIMEEHGGSIRLLDREGYGAVFLLAFPLHPEV